MNPPGLQEIHLWCIADTPLGADRLACLSPDEQARYERIQAASVKQQYGQTRFGIRRILSLYAPSVPISRWQFVRNAHGRPDLHAPGLPFGLRFNISHTKGLIVIAVSRDGDIGVDIEGMGRQARALDLAHRYFSARELADLHALAPDAQAERFLHLWTLKEAYIKACGMGLAIPLDSFSFVLGRDDIGVAFAASREDVPERWRFWQLRLMDTYLCAIALGRETHPADYTLQILHFQEGDTWQAAPAAMLAASTPTQLRMYSSTTLDP